ncbi:DUF3325 family protein [Pseudomonas sp. CFBP 8772]|uniref:DUF3325 family protein n=1 Tax=Pseudomonas sp. CFBP 8772 TaxID=2775284 RepID=UPI001780B2B7|nr:DUF3325 family protein [Pseudomonas sp. CFBP 8772]MBD8599018.1 DUF3325 family protein [Pseudomonas sp. CFBP 8772]
MSLLTWSALLYAALTALCLSLNRHYRDVFNNRPIWPSQRALRCLGFTGIAGSLIFCIASTPDGRSWVMWFCTFAVLGYTISVGLAYFPHFISLAGKTAVTMFLTAVTIEFSF